MLKGLDLGAAEAQIAEILDQLYAAYRARDAELLEINPLALLADGRVVALDCKFVLDDAALYRQPEIANAGSRGAMTDLEKRGAEAGLKLIQLDGNVGVLANGAGLTMTTMDVIRHYGGRPANFLEIGGEAYTKSEIALDLVLSNPGVKSLVINFCGAFARTDVMADGVVKAWHKLKPKVPVFFSIHGTGEDEAVKLVRERARHRALRFHGRRHPGGGKGGAMIVRKKDRVVVLGITGKQGTFWTEKMIAYGTNVVGGVNPKRAGETHVGVPIFATTGEAAQKVGADVAVMFIPPPMAKDAAVSAAEAGVKLLVVLTEHIPAQDVMAIHAAAAKHGTRIVGPNTAGLVTPGECFVGIMPAFVPSVFKPGRVGVISRSGSLGTLVCLNLTRAGLGQSAFIGIGGDPMLGTTTRDALEALDKDAGTDAIVIVGEIGGGMEEAAAEYARNVQQADGRLHRRRRRAAGQEDGPRRRHRHRQRRQLRGKTQGAGSGRRRGRRHAVANRPGSCRRPQQEQQGRRVTAQNSQGRAATPRPRQPIYLPGRRHVGDRRRDRLCRRALCRPLGADPEHGDRAGRRHRAQSGRRAAGDAARHGLLRAHGVALGGGAVGPARRPRRHRGARARDRGA